MCTSCPALLYHILIILSLSSITSSWKLPGYGDIRGAQGGVVSFDTSIFMFTFLAEKSMIWLGCILACIIDTIDISSIGTEARQLGPRTFQITSSTLPQILHHASLIEACADSETDNCWSLHQSLSVTHSVMWQHFPIFFCLLDHTEHMAMQTYAQFGGVRPGCWEGALMRQCPSESNWPVQVQPVTSLAVEYSVRL